MILIGKVPQSDVDLINIKLRDYYGRIDDKPRYRIVWSEDEIERRIVTHTKDGFELLQPIVQERYKYRQWIQSKYLLEVLTEVPDFTDMIAKISYEPLYCFENKQGQALVPRWDVTRIIVETRLNNMEHGVARYIDPDLDPIHGKEYQETRIKELQEYLFADDSDISDALHLKEAVVVPQEYQS